MQLGERTARVQPELAREQHPHPLEGCERICLAPGAVQGPHQLAPGPFLERVLLDERLELGDQLARATGREVDLDPRERRLQALLLERALPACEAAFPGDVGQRHAAEQRERLAQPPPRLRVIVARGGHEPLELGRVERESTRGEAVSGLVALEQAAEQLAQLR